MPNKEYIEDESGATFTVHSSKENLNELVNAYLDKELGANGSDYTIRFDEDVQLMGSIIAFETEVPVNITFEPDVQENGDIILQSTEMSLGLLRLPKNKILEYVDKRIDTPEWLTINPKEEQIYIAVTQIEMNNNFRAKVQRFDLENDQISFRIKVPNQKLGL